MKENQRDRAGAPGAAAGPAHEATPGRRTLTEPGDIRAAALRGVADAGQALPFAAAIQRSFGHHDVGGIRAHVGGPAATAIGELGATGYALGEHVALADGADLRVVAHEAAHVVQQRGGAAPSGGVDAPGDEHERHADEVAALVVAGASAEALLDRYARPGTTAPAPASAPVQRDLRTVGDFTKSGDNYQWLDHVTNRNAADGYKLPAKRVAGLGGKLDNSHAPTFGNAKPAWGNLGATKEATQVNVLALGPGVPQGALPGTWSRPADLGKQIALAKGMKSIASQYQVAQLLPARFGGAKDAKNLVALPGTARAELETRAHATLDRLVDRAGAWVSYRAQVTTGSESFQKTVTKPKKQTITTPVNYTSSVKVTWHELDSQMNAVAGTHGEFEVQAPAPSAFVASKTAASTMVVPQQTQGATNRAHTPAARDANTAISWATDVAWGKLHASGDGTEMEAKRLGPDHMQGTQPAHRQKGNGAPYVWDYRTGKMIKDSAGRTYIAGHLLNHHVGGPGNDARNLVAIPADVNHKMESEVEDPVKELVNKQNAWIYYKAKATHQQDTGGKNRWYASKLEFDWHQLDAHTGDAVAGTAGRAEYNIDEPSAIAGAVAPTAKTTKGVGGTAAKKQKAVPTKAATFTSTVTAPTHANAQAGTATTTPAFNQVILEDQGTLRPILVYQSSLLKVLERMQLHEHFHEQTNQQLTNNVALIFQRHKPGSAEAKAWEEIDKIDTKLAALDLGTVDAPKRIGKLADKLLLQVGIARFQRGLRSADLRREVDDHLGGMYTETFAGQAQHAFDEGLQGYEHELAQAEHLAETLATVAKKTANEVEEKRQLLRDTANELRKWLGKPALDAKADTGKLKDELFDHSEQIGNASFAYPTYGGASPGQHLDAGIAVSQTTSQPAPKTLHEAQSLVVRHSNKTHTPLPDVTTAHAPSGTKAMLGKLLDKHASRWPVPGTDAQFDQYGVHVRVQKLAAVIDKTGYDADIVDPVIDAIYAQNVAELRTYTKFVYGLYGL